MPNEAFAVHIQWDKAGLTNYDRYLETHQGKALEKKIDSAMGKEIKPLAGKIKASASSSGIHFSSEARYVARKSGKGRGRQVELLRSINAHKPRKRSGEVSAWTVGPTAPHAHLVIRGHRIVTPGGRDTGRRARAFPFVDRPVDAEAAALQAQLSSDVWASSIRPL